MASINRDRDHHHPGGARAAVRNDSAAPGQLEDHLRTIRESAFLLDDTLRSGLDRGSEGADTSLRATALTSSAKDKANRRIEPPRSHAPDLNSSSAGLCARAYVPYCRPVSVLSPSGAV